MMLAKRVMPAVTTPRESSETFRQLVEGVQDVAIFMLDGAGRVSTWNSAAERIKDCAIFMLDRGGRVASWNAAAERIKGYRAHEIMGGHFSTFYPPDDVAQGKPQWALEIAEREGRHEDEGWRVRKDGTRFWANTVISPMRDLQGGLIGYAKVTRDLTQRRRAEQALVLLRQVLVNLIGNAFKFSVKRAHPKVEIGAEQHGSEVAYYVKDNGVGFDMQYAGKLFGVFQRLHRPDEFEGTGVGLALAQRIIQRHGGRLWAEGKVSEGATFRVP